MRGAGGAPQSVLILSLASLLLTLASLLPVAADAGGRKRNVNVFVSIDGFKPAYLDRVRPKNLLALAQRGVRVSDESGMRPVYPSKTFPNHYSLVTGLFPEAHGIVSNHFWAPDLNSEFTLRTQGENGTFYENGYPVWQTLEEEGVKVACNCYPACAAGVHGSYPTTYLKWNDRKRDFKARTVQSLEWLDQNKALEFLLLYFDGVDHAGHVYGPDSSQVDESVRVVDDCMGTLIHGLEKRDIEYNMVVVADHGMANIIGQVDMDQWLGLDKGNPEVFMPDLSPLSAVWPRDRDGNYTQKAQTLMSNPPKHVAVERRVTFEKVPPGNEVASSIRMPDYTLAFEEGWAPYSRRGSGLPVGSHGWNNSWANMSALFIAAGPKIRNEGKVIEGFPNVNVYTLLCLLAGVKPRSNNGTDPEKWARDNVLRPESPLKSSWILMGVLGGLTAIVVVLSVLYYRRNQSNSNKMSYAERVQDEEGGVDMHDMTGREPRPQPVGPTLSLAQAEGETAE